MNFLKTSHALLALSILSALCTPAALAAPIVVAPVGLFSSSFSTDAGLVSLQSDSSMTSAVTASSSLSSANGDTGGSTGVFPAGSYVVSTFASGGTVALPTSSEALSNLTFLLTNSTAFAQNFFLTLRAYGGNLNTVVNDPAGLTGQEAMSTGYSAKVERVTDPLNNTRTTLFSSTATLLRDTSGTTLARSGTTLTGASSLASVLSSGVYTWDTDLYTIDLGVVDAGAFTQIDANLSGFSQSNVGTYQGGFKGWAGQYFGDPVGGLDTGVFAFESRPVGNTVPEPGSLLLAGAALGAAGLMRRRKAFGSH